MHNSRQRYGNKKSINARHVRHIYRQDIFRSCKDICRAILTSWEITPIVVFEILDINIGCVRQSYASAFYMHDSVTSIWTLTAKLSFGHNRMRTCFMYSMWVRLFWQQCSFSWAELSSMPLIHQHNCFSDVERMSTLLHQSAHVLLAKIESRKFAALHVSCNGFRRNVNGFQ